MLKMLIAAGEHADTAARGQLTSSLFRQPFKSCNFKVINTQSHQATRKSLPLYRRACVLTVGLTAHSKLSTPVSEERERVGKNSIVIYIVQLEMGVLGVFEYITFFKIILLCLSNPNM